MRRVAVVVWVALMTLALAAPAGAQEPSGPPTSAPFDLDDCVSAIPKPGCGTEPTSSGDRGGWAQYAVFGVMVAGLAVVGTVVVRSTRRTTASREAALDPPV